MILCTHNASARFNLPQARIPSLLGAHTNVHTTLHNVYRFQLADLIIDRSDYNITKFDIGIAPIFFHSTPNSLKSVLIEMQNSAIVMNSRNN